MSSKPTTTVLAALDASGSMYNVADDVRGGFNQYMQDLTADEANEYRVSLVTFNTNIDRITEDARPVDVPEIDSHNYQPSGGTALFDAIGTLITGPVAEGGKVLVVIHTDGHENSSREWRKHALVRLIESRKADGWTFVFLGAGVDTWRQGEDLGMSSVNTRSSRAGTRGTYEGVAGQTVALASRGISGDEFAEYVGRWSQYRDEEARLGLGKLRKEPAEDGE